MNEERSIDVFWRSYSKAWQSAALALLVLVYVFIFAMSARSAADTDVTSAAVSDPVIAVVYPDREELPAAELAGIRFDYQELARTVAHALEYCALGALWFFTLLRSGQRRPWRWLLPFALGALTGLADECFQELCGRGRTFQVKDLIVDASGAALGVLCAFALWLLIRFAMDARPKAALARRRVSGVLFSLFWGALLVALFFKVPLVWCFNRAGAAWYRHEAWYLLSAAFFTLYLLGNLRFRLHRGLKDMDIALAAFLALFLGAVALWFLKGETGVKSVAGTVAWFLPLLCGIVAYYLDGDFHLRPYAASLAGVAGLNLACVAAQYLTNSDFFGMALYSSVSRYGGQFPGFQMTALDSGMLCCYLLAYALWLLLSDRRIYVKLPMLLLAAASLFGVWFSKTRNVFVLAVCLLLLLVLYRVLRRYRLGRIFAFAAPIFAALCYGAISIYVYVNGTELLLKKLEFLTVPILSLNSTIDRVELWVSCLQDIPAGGLWHLLFGYGLCQASETRESIMYSDSIYIDMVWICGLLGLALFLYVLARLLLRLLRHEREGTDVFTLYAMCASCVFAGCFNILTHTQCAILLLALCWLKNPLPDKSSVAVAGAGSAAGGGRVGP